MKTCMAKSIFDEADPDSAELAGARRPPPQKPKAKGTGTATVISADGVRAAEHPSQKIDRLIVGIPDWRGNVLAAIRRIMLEADPAVTEDWKWMGSPVWYCAGMICVANAHRDKVKCTFSKGAHFADPGHLFNAGLDGKEWRAIDIFENDLLDAAALTRLVRTAIAYNRSRLRAKGK